MRKYCETCGKAFEASRKDAKYCSDSCKTRKYQQTKAKRQEVEARKALEKAESSFRDERIYDQIKKLEKENGSLSAKVENANERMKELATSIPFSEELLGKINTNIKNSQTELRKQPWDIYNERFNEEYLANPDGYNAQYHLMTERKYNDYIWSRVKAKVDATVPPYLAQMKKELEAAQGWRKKILHKMEEEKSEQANLPVQQERWMRLIKLNQQRLIELDKLRFTRSNKQPSPPTLLSSHKPRKAQLSAQEIVSGDFDGFTISGELGRFMGNLERYMLAIAITGEPGAGKSYFTFELTKGFVDVGLRVKYYSLEEGLSRPTKEKLVKYGLETVESDLLMLTSQGTLASLKKDAKAKIADVFIVDSYGKLKARPEDLDKLRHEFPDSIFIFNFQQTTKGGTKGGAAIEFDCSMRIICHKTDEGGRYAEMRKSRYGTQGWKYDTIEGKVISIGE